MARKPQRQPFDPFLIPEPTPEVAGGERWLTVSQLTSLVKQALERAFAPTIHVVGEISNLKRHGSGHWYLTLKDAAAELSCVMWRSDAARLKFTPTDGMEVVATGGLEVFERAGRYQLYIRRIEPRGVGALELAFRQLREKLAAQGLFDPQHKKPLPAFPRRIALVTSPTGAAIADMRRTLARRFPCVEAWLYPVRVQGPGAAEEIAAAIRKLNRAVKTLGDIDLLIVGRGGGSLEDLWAFNEEVVVRAIFESRIPVISAVGHETDVSLADLAADVRAATPTAAAELAVPVLEDVLARLDGYAARLTRAATATQRLMHSHFGGLLQRRLFREPLTLVRIREQMVDEAAAGLAGGLQQRTGHLRRRLDRVEPLLQRIAPQRYLLHTMMTLTQAQHRLRWAMLRRLQRADQTRIRLQRRIEQASPEKKLPRWGERLRRLSRAMPLAMGHRLATLRARLAAQESVLRAVGHESVLARGFSVTRLRRGRKVIRSIEQLHDGDRVITRVADGEFESDVVNLNQLELF